MIEREAKLRKDICEAARGLYAAGFMSGSNGNLSTLLGDEEILVTPSGVWKGYLTPEQIVKIDRQGNQLAGELKPTVEVAMHLATYEEKNHIKAVAHCHPPILTAFTVSGIDLPAGILPEMEMMFGGSIPVAPYAQPGTPELAASIRAGLRQPGAVAVLLDHHGLLTVGRDVFQAAIRAEHAEDAAKVIYFARNLGWPQPLEAAHLQDLREVHRRATAMENQMYAPQRDQPDHSELVTASGNKIATNQQNLEQIVRHAIQKVLAEND